MTGTISIAAARSSIRQRVAQSLDSGLLRGTGTVLVAFVTSRLLIFWVILLSRSVVIGGEFWHTGGLLGVLVRGEGQANIHIAQWGYSLTDQQLSIGFFPLYPWLVRAVGVLGGYYAVAAVVVANFFLLAAGILLNALMNLDAQDRRVRRGAVMFLMFTPLAVFYSSAYTESTFLMLALAAMLAARCGQWPLASVCGMFVAATQNVGIVILLPLLVEYLRPWFTTGAPRPRLLSPRLLLFLLVPLGACYWIWEGFMRLPKPWLYWHAKITWGGTFLPPRRAVAILNALPPFYWWFAVIAFAGALTLHGAAHLMKLRPSYLTYSAALIVFAFCTNTPESMPRFLSVIFPLYIALAMVTASSRWAYETVLVAFITALTFCTVLRATGYWLV